MESTIFKLPTGEFVFSGHPAQSVLWQALKSDSVSFCFSFVSLMMALWFFAG